MSSMAKALFVGAVLVALLAVACGDDGGGDDEATPATAATTAAPEAEATSEPAAEATSAADVGATTGSGGSPSGGVDVLGSQRCRDATVALAEAMQSTGAGFGALTQPQVEELEQALNAAAEDAPQEIRDAITVFARAWDALANAIQESGWNPAAGQAPPPEVMQAFQEFSTADLAAASEELDAWFRSNCPA